MKDIRFADKEVRSNKEVRNATKLNYFNGFKTISYFEI